jgi:hypothetical protein
LGTSIADANDHVVVAVDEERLKIDSSAIEYLAAHANHARYLVVLIGDEHSFLAAFDDFGGAYPLICVDSHSGMLRWSQTVWGFGNRFICMGSWWHDISIVQQRDRVAVCGTGNSTYVECFDLTTGQPMLRFAANFWDQFHPCSEESAKSSSDQHRGHAIQSDSVKDKASLPIE